MNAPTNTPSNTMPDSALPSQVIRPAVMSATRPIYWSVRREFWENRSIYIAPLVAAAVFLFGFLISLIGLPHRMRAALALDPAQQREGLAMPYDMVAGLMMLTGILVSVFYCLDALHGERRDRSILFWKSLPVSDLSTVLAKASIPLIVLPLLTLVITVVTHLIMLLCSSAVLLGSGLSVATLWRQLPLFHMSLLLLYHLVTAHALWPAPIYCWLLLVSGWARRAAFLWAALPLLAIGGVEAIVFRTSYFAGMLGSRIIGDAPAIAFTMPEVFPTNPMTHITPSQFLTSAGLWIGLAVAAAFLAAAVRLRHYRGPI
jgi:ABC-2 type transport system permease protein